MWCRVKQIVHNPTPPKTICSFPAILAVPLRSSSASFYEYLDKSARLLGDEEMGEMFREAYAGIEEHLKWGRWHVEVDMWKGSGGSPSNYRVTALQAFWPAVQAGAGDVRAAERTYDSLLDLWKEHEALPDFYDVLNGRYVWLCVCVCFASAPTALTN